MRVLITGVAGFVGSRLVRHLAERGDEIAGTVIPAQPLLDLHSGGRAGVVQCHEVDLADRPALCRVVDDVSPDAIVHLGGLSDVGASWKDPASYHQVNVQGTENLLEAARGRARVVFASSAEVYGKVRPEMLPLREHQPAAPATPYAMSKAAAELLALREGAVVVRSFNLVGPGQSNRFALPSFAEQLLAIEQGAAEAILRVGNLDSRRDFLHVDDGVEGYRLLCEAGEPGGVYNLSSGEPVVMSQALDRLIEITGLEVKLELDPDRLRPSDVPVMAGDPGKLEALGWRRSRSFEQALQDLWQGLHRL